jgi:hypothetical protein
VVDWRHFDDPRNWDADFDWSGESPEEQKASWLNPDRFQGTFKNELSMDFGDDDEDPEMYDVSPRAPADLTDRPTSTTNVARPRTLAAGYDKSLNGGTLTVVFRDGTFWNYYDVTEGEWQNFHSSISKGKPWLKPGGTIASKRNGPADVSTLPPDVQASLINYRRIQIAAATKRKYRNGGKIAKFSRASNSRIKNFGKKYN